MTTIVSDFLDSIEIQDLSSTPKYQQIIDSVIAGIQEKRFQRGDLLPSINEFSNYLEISRDTVEKAYRFLKNKEIISSTPGKGYFIALNEVKKGVKIAFLLNKLSEHKKIVYDSFAKEIGYCASLDLFVYNSDLSYLQSLLPGLAKVYDYYVLFPHFREGSDKAADIINKYIPTNKLLLLSKFIPDIKGEFPAVYENHEADIYLSLNKALTHLKKYKKLKLVFPDHSDYPKAIIKGFYRFCHENHMEHILVSNLKVEKVEAGCCYINLAEKDLVVLIEKVIQKRLNVGIDVGIISYNETPLKKFILKGITTVSTDFDYMGRAAAKLIKEKNIAHIEVPFHLTVRDSI